MSPWRWLRRPGPARKPGPSGPPGSASSPESVPSRDEAWSAFERLTPLVPRRDFLPADQQRFADDDRPLPIGHGSANSQPSTVATMLALLDVRPGQRILDVGAGSGWTTCLLAALTGPGGSVLGTEIDERVAQFGAANVARWSAAGGAAYTADYILATPGVLGCPDRAPYDRILVSAMATGVPDELVSQLAPGGLMVIPTNGRMARVRRPQDAGAGPEITYVGWYRFVPLR